MSIIIGHYIIRLSGRCMLPDLSVSEFVALFNQTLEFAYPNVTIIGELAQFPYQ